MPEPRRVLHVPAALAVLVVLACVSGLAVVLLADRGGAPSAAPDASTAATSEGPERAGPAPTSSPAAPSPDTRASAPPPPRDRVFAGSPTLVAFYGTGGTGSLGVLGETDPQTMHRRLMRAARPFARPGRPRPGRPVVPVYELIVTVADPVPGPDRDFSHDIPRSVVRQYVDLARRTGPWVVLDVQPGRSRFPDVVRRWEWGLREPHVGLALDPEWRMARDEVPGRVIGSVGAREVDLTAAWLARLVDRYDLPQKPFVLHQFRTDMVRDPGRILDRPALATIQHVDGFGTPGQKLDTYRAVARPRQFHQGFKLFYDEDTDLMSPAAVLGLTPRVRFVSYQ